MSEFKFSRLLFLAAILGLGLLVGFAIGNGKRTEPTEPIHSISLYSAEGDTILDIDTNSDWVKVWIGDSCGVDVWTINEEGGWTRK
jgi:hypothetical protein